ncbi:MAG: hypothetical protein E3J64_10410, partial [Anaerolineales bacterium]
MLHWSQAVWGGGDSVFAEPSRPIRRSSRLGHALCGCARCAAESLVGASVDEAAEKAGLLHHHYPCLASMGKDPDFGDTLMHISGHILKEQVAEQVKFCRDVAYVVPGEL